MNWSDPATLATPVGTTEFNATSGADGFRLTPDTSGLDQGPLRATVDDASQTHGGIVHPFFGAARRPTIIAQYLIRTGTVQARDDAIDALIAQLDSIRQADGTWTQHRAGGDRHITVRCEIPLTSSGGPNLKQVVFGLVAANPAWT